MDFSRFFIDRPIFAAVISMFIFISGLLSVRNLPVSEFPGVVPPSVQVRAQYPGANPQVIADTVASMFTTTPFFRPAQGWVPTPMMSIPSSVSSPTRQATLVVPMSRPTISSSRFAMVAVFPLLSGRAGGVPRG